MALKARAHESNLRVGLADTRPDVLLDHPINLLPVIEPYRKHGRLTLRIEHLPPKARFSAGARAGEKSWSLAAEDLPELKYQLLDGSSTDHSFTIRVIGIERGDTLAVLTQRVDDILGSTRSDAGDVGADSVEVQKLQELLREAQLSFENLQRVHAETEARFETEMAAWKAQEAERLQKAQLDWQARQAAAIEQRDRDWQCKLQAGVAKVEAEQSENGTLQVEAALRAAKEEWSVDTARQLAEAKRAWQLQESARLAELEQRWSLQLKETAAKALVAAPVKPGRDTDAELKSASAAWQAAEARRMAEAKLEWQRQEDERVLALQTGFEARLKEVQSTLDAAVAKTPAPDSGGVLRAAREEWEAEAEKRLRAAQREWESGEISRLEAVKRQWDAKLVEAVALERARSTGTQRADADTELHELRDTIVSLQSLIVERESALQSVAKALEAEKSGRSRESVELRAEYEASLKQERDRARELSLTLDQNRAEWQRKNEQEINRLTVRAETAEASLVQLRGYAAESARLDKEVTALRAALATRNQILEGPRVSAEAESEDPASMEKQAAAAGRKSFMTRLPPFSREIAVGVICAVAAVWLTPVSQQPPALATEQASIQPLVTVPVQTLLPTSVVVSTTRLRRGPAKTERVIVRVDRGTEVSVLEAQDTWTRIKMNYKTTAVEGWVETATLDLPKSVKSVPGNTAR